MPGAPPDNLREDRSDRVLDHKCAQYVAAVQGLLQYSTTAVVALREVRQDGKCNQSDLHGFLNQISSDKPQAYHIFTEEIIAIFIDDQVNTRLWFGKRIVIHACRLPTAGVKVKVVPTPSSLSTQMRPP